MSAYGFGSILFLILAILLFRIATPRRLNTPPEILCGGVAIGIIFATVFLAVLHVTS
jgi:hypothetical protein